MTKPAISILLPTRGRTQQLATSIRSLISNADSAADIEWLLAFDNDDVDSRDYFMAEIAPDIDRSGGEYRVWGFERLGYARLHQYLNALAAHARADWWVFWNDDAVMLDPHWDTVITSQGDRFCVQAFDTHRQHPYSIFPIVPRAWWEVLGHLSQHPLNDAYISQIAWPLDIMVRLDVRVEHQRFDLTGANQDNTFQERNVAALEGDPSRPQDFNHVSQRQRRWQDALRLCQHLENQGLDMTHFRETLAGRRDPWTKMLAMDINGQMTRTVGAPVSIQEPPKS